MEKNTVGCSAHCGLSLRSFQLFAGRPKERPPIKSLEHMALTCIEPINRFAGSCQRSAPQWATFPYRETIGMAETNPVDKIQSELREGMGLPKCRKCSCMKKTLKELHNSLPSLQIKSSSELLANIQHWLEQMEPIKYACLGCDYCFPAEAMNIFHTAFPEVGESLALSYAFELSEHSWPPVAGEYYPFCDGPGCPRFLPLPA